MGNDAKLSSLTDFLEKLSRAKTSFRLDYIREDSVMVEIAVPGERWEVEFLADGSVEIERFRSQGKIEDASALDELFSRFSD